MTFEDQEQGTSPDILVMEAREKVLSEEEDQELNDLVDKDPSLARNTKTEYVVTKLVEKYQDGGLARNYLKRIIEAAGGQANESLVRNPLNGENLRINTEGEVVSVAEDGTETPLE